MSASRRPTLYSRSSYCRVNSRRSGRPRSSLIELTTPRRLVQHDVALGRCRAAPPCRRRRRGRPRGRCGGPSSVTTSPLTARGPRRSGPRRRGARRRPRPRAPSAGARRRHRLGIASPVTSLIRSSISSKPSAPSSSSGEICGSSSSELMPRWISSSVGGAVVDGAGLGVGEHLGDQAARRAACARPSRRSRRGSRRPAARDRLLVGDHGERLERRLRQPRRGLGAARTRVTSVVVLGAHVQAPAAADLAQLEAAADAAGPRPS